MELLISLAVALLAGLFMSRLAKVLGLPAVTAYLVAGILIGPYCLGFLGERGLGWEFVDRLTFIGDPGQLGIISDVALGFIAFSIGNEFRTSDLKNTGKKAVVVACFEAIAATILVDLVLLVLHFILGEDVLSVPVVLTLGAVACATAPAATLMVVRQYKAKGPVTGTLLPVVALDDAVGLAVFAVSFGVAKTLVSGEFDLIAVLFNPIIEIVGSLLLGFLAGWLFSFSERFFHSRSKRLSISVAFVLLTVAISMLEIRIGHVTLSFSPLLSCMMLGTVFCNICDFSAELMDRLDRWTGPLFILFFVFSGAGLDFSVFSHTVYIAIGAVYMVVRVLGKMLGAAVGSRLMRCEPQVVKYLGITLMPQAGVALGMSLTAANELGASGALIRNIVLFAVLVYELIGPLCTKIALTRAGEIIPEQKVSSRNTGKI